MVADLSKMDVLVIDDELGPRESLRMLLKTDCDVRCASSVDEGVTALQERPPDIIIMDIRMPGKTGIEGLGEIRRVDPLVSVVMLTGFGCLETAQQALRLGANDYLNKPFDTKVMQATVRRYAERTRLERKRFRMLDELNTMNTRLIHDVAEKEKLAALGQTSAEFIHDLRNPLTIISGYVELLSGEIEKTKEMNGSAGEYLDVIEKNIQRCCEMSKCWQRFGKSPSSAFGPVHIGDILEELSPGVELLASTRGVDMRFGFGDRDTVVQGSSAQLIRAIHNVVSNAIQATQPGTGRVTLACDRTKPDCVEIRVEDNGCGMAPDVLAKVFTPYFTTRSSEGGTGLGMGITRKIVEEHEGTLGIDSEPGRGTTVTIRLPCRI